MRTHYTINVPEYTRTSPPPLPTIIHIHTYTWYKEREVFIAEGSLSLAQFYYRNNVKAASFEVAWRDSPDEWNCVFL